MFAPLNEYRFNDEAVARQQAKARAELERMRREELKAAKKSAVTASMKALDQQESALRKLSLTAAALNAALAAIHREREEIQAKANGKRGASVSRAERLISQLPETAARYRAMIDKGAQALTDPHLVSAAREAMKKLIKDGTIVLTPNATHTPLVGKLQFNDFGDHILGLNGNRRHVKAVDEFKKSPGEKVQENQEKATVVAGACFGLVQ